MICPECGHECGFNDSLCPGCGAEIKADSKEPIATINLEEDSAPAIGGTPIGPWNSKKVKIARAISHIADVNEQQVYGIINDFLKTISENIKNCVPTEVENFGTFSSSRQGGQTFKTNVPSPSQGGGCLFGWLFGSKSTPGQTRTVTIPPYYSISFKPAAELVEKIHGNSPTRSALLMAQEKYSDESLLSPDLPAAISKARAGDPSGLRNVREWMLQNGMHRKLEELKKKFPELANA